jgi:hypothetical protein
LNITDAEIALMVIAKPCGCKAEKRKATYSFSDTYHNLCLDRRDILLAQLEACERLLKYVKDEDDNEAIKKEMAELKAIVDLISL